MFKKIAVILLSAFLFAGCSGAQAVTTAEIPSIPAEFDAFTLAPYVFGDDAAGMPQKANPVNLEETKIEWNGRDVTEDKKYRKNPKMKDALEQAGKYQSFVFINQPYVGSAQKNWAPCNGFEVSVPAGGQEAVEKLPSGVPIRFLWTDYLTSDGGIHYLTFGCNEKKIQRISFTGLPDETLRELRPDGLTLQFDAPGEYELTYEVVDTNGVAPDSPAKYVFEVG